MPTLPSDYLSLIQVFAPYFSNLVWQQAQVLLIGAILVPGRRTVTAVLRIMGLSEERQFQTYHRVLNRAVWSSWALSRTLLKLLVQTWVPTGPIICGLDDTIERRRGAQIKAKGIYRDPVRSSHGHFVKASGLRWLSLTPAPPPGACAVGADPLGEAHLGLALLDLLGAVGTLLSEEGPRAQEADRLGPPNGDAAAALAAWPPVGHRRRQQFCRDFVAVSVVAVARATLPDRSLPLGRGLVCAGAQTASGSTRPAALERQAPARLGAGRAEHQNEMEAGRAP